ncbi:MAG TPA: thrombospondin type 3 repeat-containing protein [Phycisphaerae bacterium]|nr:thrombospondin type 3 repeat-containing protein [Phycisphaerae bacterium]
MVLKSLSAVSLLFALSLPGGAVHAQTIFFVDATVPVPGDGSSWNNAFADLSTALDAAGSVGGPREIRVAKGVYKPDTTGLGDPRTATFAMQADLEILGGYPGHMAADPDLRDPLANATTLNGDIGVAVDTSDNCYHVVTMSGIPDSGLIDGFRIRNGNADGTVFPHNGAGGVLIDTDSGAIIRNCVIRDCLSSSGGSGMRITNSSPLIDGCLISGNQSANGGGIYAISVVGATCSPRFENCRLENNTATVSDGGAFYSNGASPVFVGSVFVDNVAGNRGAGLITYGGSAYVANCAFFNNQATNIGGGGVWVAGAAVTIVNSVFSGNTAPAASGFGGAIHTQQFATVDATLTVANCTIAYNSAGIGGGGINLNGGDLTLINSILYFNDDHGGTVMDIDSQFNTTLPFTVSVNDHNCIQGWSGSPAGTSMQVGDPFFRDADGDDNIIGTPDDDYALMLASPCIDAASNANVPSDGADVDGDGDSAEPTPLDRDGNPRFQDQPSVGDSGDGTSPIVDLGALEFRTDCDVNGMADADEIAMDPSLDCDTNGVLDFCEFDSDADGVINACDNCPAIPNAGQTDADSDGLGDACDVCQGNDATGDTDADGVCDDIDPCPLDATDDSDGDGICDGVDPCPADNPNDSDGDGVCDSADPCPQDMFDDSDGDGVCDSNDPCPADNPDDSDGDGVCDSADPCPQDALNDSDGDGVCDSGDGCPADPAKTAPGACGCGVEDADSDANGVADCLEGGVTPAPLVQMSGDCCAAGSGPLVSFLAPMLWVARRRRLRRRRAR